MCVYREVRYNLFKLYGVFGKDLEQLVRDRYDVRRPNAKNLYRRLYTAI